MKVDPKCELENKKDPPDLLCERVDLKSVSVDSKARNNHMIYKDCVQEEKGINEDTAVGKACGFFVFYTVYRKIITVYC